MDKYLSIPVKTNSKQHKEQFRCFFALKRIGASKKYLGKWSNWQENAKQENGLPFFYDLC